MTVTPAESRSVGSTNADRDATAARCRVSSASGTRTEARLASAAEERRPQVDDLADQRRLAHQRAHPRPAERREPRERRGEVVGAVDEARQDRRVLDSLTAALAQMRTHRMGRVADQDDRTARPLPGLVAVVEVVAQHVVGVGRGQHGGDRVGPDAELGLQVRQLALRRGSGPPAPRSVANQ